MRRKIRNPKSEIRIPIIAAWLALTAGFGLVPAAHAVTYCYVTVHNLGCLQTNQTYTGFIFPYPDLGEGDLVQLILAGPNRVINPPNADGTPGGDDQLALNPGAQFAMNPESFTHYPSTFYSPEAILVQSDNNGPQPAIQPGSRFYVRVWNGPTPAQSTAYYNSQKLTLDYPVNREGCPIDSAVRTFPNEIQIPMLLSYAVVLEDVGHPYSPQNTVILNAPSGGESFAVGSVMTIQWFASPGYAQVDILIKRGAGQWVTLFDGIPNDGSEEWSVAAPENPSCLLRVQAAADTIVFDTCNASFAIIPQPSLVLNAPDPNDELMVGTEVNIGWTSTGIIPGIRVLLSRDGAAAETLYTATGDDGAEVWTVTGPETMNCQLRIESIANSGVFDDVGPLLIVEPLSITLAQPSAGDSVAVGDTLEFAWSTTGAVGPLRLLLERGAAAAETLFAALANDGSEAWPVTAPPTDSARFRLESAIVPAVGYSVYPVLLTDSTYSGPPISPEIVAAAAADSLRIVWPPVGYATSYRIEASADLAVWDSVTTVADTAFVLPTPELMPPVRYFRVIGIR